MIFRWVILFFISWAAATISGSAGFGGALILLPILNGFVGIKAAVPILSIAQLLGNLSRAGFGFSKIRWRPAGFFMLGALPATILGSRLFVSLPKHWINIGLGVLLILLVIMHRLKLFDLKIKGLILIPGGVLVSFLSAVAGSAGPLGAAFFLGLDLPSTAYVASEAVTAVGMHLTKTIIYNKYSLIGMSDLMLGGFLGIAIVLGSWTGKKIIEKTSERDIFIFSGSFTISIRDTAFIF